MAEWQTGRQAGWLWASKFIDCELSNELHAATKYAQINRTLSSLVRSQCVSKQSGRVLPSDSIQRCDWPFDAACYESDSVSAPGERICVMDMPQMQPRNTNS